MLRTLKTLLFLLPLILVTADLSAQNAKKYLKDGKKYYEAQNNEAAEKAFSTAIELDATLDEAFVYRARLYERLDKLDEALADYQSAANLDIENEELYFKMGEILYTQKKLPEAIKQLDLAIRWEDDYLKAFVIAAIASMELEEWDKAKGYWSKAIYNSSKAPNPYYQFYQGQVFEELKDTTEAEKSYLKATKLSRAVTEFNDKAEEKDPAREHMYNQYHFFLNLGIVRMQLNKLDEAKLDLDVANSIDLKDATPNYLIGKIMVRKGELESSIDYFTRAIVRDKKHAKSFYARGVVRFDRGDNVNAISDFSSALAIDPEFHNAVYYRGAANLAMGEADKARNDLMAIAEKITDPQVRPKLMETLFELNKEKDPPEVVITAPYGTDKILYMPKDAASVMIEGTVKDVNPIASITINGKPANYNKEMSNPGFNLKVVPPFPASFAFEAKDVYGNTTSINLTMEHNETTAPEITINYPGVSSDNDMFVAGHDKVQQYVEGEIYDESPIKSIKFDGEMAQFSKRDKNPYFKADVPIKGKEKVSVEVIDIFGNATSTTYNLVKGQASSKSATGNLLIVFIENTVYRDFESLKGPAKDYRVVKDALSNYDYSSFHHKTNMTKGMMDEFFSVTLKKVIRDQNIKSLLVWYAGHGKFQQGTNTGYWIPVDARRDRPSTFFGLDALKGYVSSYSSLGTKHLLVVSDACESGSGFLLARRGEIPTAKDCAEIDANEPASAQVFTSSGYELAKDESTFTRAFATALSTNAASCISIDQIRSKVDNAMKNEGVAPSFGPIVGIDGGQGTGTFWFFKK